MSDGLYVAMMGASARLDQLDVIADNLANADTPGFKASLPSFQAIADQANGTTGGAGSQVYAVASPPVIDQRPGGVMPTGRPLDVRPQDGVYLAVAGSSGPAYTRNGSIQVDAAGQLTIGGRPVLNASANPINVPAGTSVSIAEDGSVLSGKNVVDHLAFVQINGPLQRVGASLVAPTAGGAAMPVEARLVTGQLEHSNVNPLQLTVDLVSAQRSYESAMQAIQTYKTLDDTLTDVGRVR